MDQHTAPAFTMATLGDPKNNIVIVKHEDGHWRHLNVGFDNAIVTEKDLGINWSLYTPNIVPLMDQFFGRQDGKESVNPEQDLKLACLDRARKDLPDASGSSITSRARDYEFYLN